LPIRHLAADDSALGATAKGIARMVAAAGYEGVVLDFEALGPSDASALLKVAGVITDSVRGAGTRLVAMAVPAADTITYPTKALLGRVDALMVMLYDEHWPGSTPGPIASPEWARAWLGARVRQSGPERLIAAFPLYGYHWRRGQTRHVSYEEARGLAEGAQVPLSRDSGSYTLHAESAELGALWVSDVGLLRRLMADARSLGVGRIAFWYLGLEEPAFWTEVVRRDRAGSS
jgi:spore germination protein YaaH